MNYQALLLGAQAAGIGTNILSARSQRRAAESGIAVDRAQLEARMEQEQVAFLEQTNASLESLAETLSTQQAILAARGSASGQGSARAFTAKSVRAQGNDVKAQKLNQQFRKQQMMGLSRLLNIQKAGVASRYAGSLLETGLSTFNLNTSIGQWLNNQAKGGGFNSSTIGPVKNKPSYKLP